MAYENDIFISYAHIDNESMTEDQKGWISAFHRALEVRMGQLLGEKPKIFRDPKLQGNDIFGDRLVETLPKTATLVSIFSPRYVRSDWCKKELLQFIEASEQSIGVRLGTKSRVFKVVKTPIPLEQHPEPVQDLLGYDFFSVDPASGRPRELHQDDSPKEKREYWAKLNDLAYDIRDLLEEMTSGGATGAPMAGATVMVSAPAPASSRSNGEPVKVFLAETSHDLHEQRGAMSRFLQQHGHTVLPDQTLPLVAGACETKLRELIAQCRMSIHLVGAGYGVVPEDTTQSLIALQNDVAVEHAATRNDFVRLIWIPPGVAASDERQRELLTAIRTDPRIQQGADILETPLSDLEIAVEEKLRTPKFKEEEAIFLAVTSHDLEDERRELARLLTDQGRVVLPDVELTERHPHLVAGECESFLSEQLKRCHMSIHLVGASYGIVPDGTTESLLTLQHRLATEHRGNGKKFEQLVWMMPGLTTEDSRQQNFVEKLHVERTDSGLELVQLPFAELEQAITKKLEPPAEEEASDAGETRDDAAPETIYLICEKRDIDEIGPIEDFLFDQGHEVLLPVFDADEAEIREEHEEALRDCDAVIVYYGAGNEPWQRRMLREVKKSSGYGRSKPPPAAAIYVAAPETAQKKRLRTRDAQVIQGGEVFAATHLEPFLSGIGG